MITYQSRSGRVILEFSKFDLGSEQMKLKITEVGDHQNEPTHRYYKPDVVIETNISSTAVQELIKGVGRLL